MIQFLLVAAGVLGLGLLIALVSSFPAWVVVLVTLGAITTSVIAGRWLLIRGSVRQEGYYTLDGREVRVVFAYGARLPKLLGHQGTFAGKGWLCFRAYPPGYPKQVVGIPPVGALLAAHELYHDIDRRRQGFRFWLDAYWMMLTKGYRDRPFEQRAVAAAPRIVAGTEPGVEARKLLARFL